MKIYTMFVMVFLMISCVTGFYKVPTASSDSDGIYVNGSYFGTSDGSADRPYTTIQRAINVAQNGDTIWIFSGVYEEELDINKQVRIIGGIDEEETIITTTLSTGRYLIEINADEVTLESVTVRDYEGYLTSPIGAFISLQSSNNRINGNNIADANVNGIYIHANSNNNLINGNRINRTKTGIWAYSSDTNDITNNIIKNSTENGIELEASSNNNILYGNTIENSASSGIKIANSNNVNITSNSITLSEYYALHVLNSLNAYITNNHINDNPGGGLYLSSSLNTVRNNTFQGNTRGITLVGDSNVIHNNSFISSSSSGIFAQGGSSDNLLDLNDFRDNSVAATDNGENQWYDNDQGNYWDDYNYIDVNPEENPDGIGDRPYTRNGVYDPYPLGYFLKPPNKPSNPSPADKETDVSLDITLTVHVEDPDTEDELTAYFYRADTDQLIDSQTQNPVKHVQNNSNIRCEFTLGFNTTFAWYVIVEDELLQNRSDTFFFYTTSTPPDNEPPVVDIGGPYAAEMEETIQFDASASYDPDGEIDFYRWNFGDATSEILKKNPTHIYYDVGEYILTLTIIDNKGASQSETTTVVIGEQTNKPPVASISTPTTGFVSESVTIESTSTDPDGDQLTYNWSIDGQYFNGEEVEYQFDQATSYVITLVVSDGQYENTASTIIDIAEREDESPGFEFILVLLSVSCIILLKRNRNIQG